MQPLTLDQIGLISGGYKTITHPFVTQEWKDNEAHKNGGYHAVVWGVIGGCIIPVVGTIPGACLGYYYGKWESQKENAHLKNNTQYTIIKTVTYY